MKMVASGPAFGFGSPGLGGMPCGLSMAQLAGVTERCRADSTSMNILGMANLSAMGIYFQRRNSLQGGSRLLLEAAGLDSRALRVVGGIGGFAGCRWARRSESVRRPVPLRTAGLCS